MVTATTSASGLVQVMVNSIERFERRFPYHPAGRISPGSALPEARRVPAHQGQLHLAKSLFSKALPVMKEPSAEGQLTQRDWVGGGIHPVIPYFLSRYRRVSREIPSRSAARVWLPALSRKACSRRVRSPGVNSPST